MLIPFAPVLGVLQSQNSPYIAGRPQRSGKEPIIGYPVK